MLEDSKIRAFLALVSEGSFTRAARKLGVTQPAVSAQIASLEKTVGQALFLRGAELKINTIPAVTYCEDCHAEYGTVAHGKICPRCGSEHTCLLRGNEVEIKEIEVPNE